MWCVLIMSLMCAATGFYALSGQKSFMETERNETRLIAEEMALYRNAVVTYFSDSGHKNASVEFAALKQKNAVPTWSALYAKAVPVWGNYRDAAGVIYVYPTKALSKNIIPDLLKISGNSVLVGVYASQTGTLYSAIAGTNLIPAAALSEKAIPNGVPVWVASTR